MPKGEGTWNGKVRIRLPKSARVLNGRRRMRLGKYFAFAARSDINIVARLELSRENAARMLC